MRLIDADDLLLDSRDISECAAGGNWIVVDVEDIENAPTIKAEPVVHGRWIPHNRMTRSPLVVNYACSECGIDGHRTNYCPNCGADMRGDQNE